MLTEAFSGKRSILGIAVAAFALAFAAGVNTAGAVITIFSGQDDGAPITGPFPNSAAAEASFLAAAAGFGGVSTATFESNALGFYSPVAAGPNLSISLSAPDFGAGFSGVTNVTFGNLNGFNTTPGGENWLGFPGGSATFYFGSGTNSLGMYLTGLQTIFTTSITLTFDDGTSQTLDLPINTVGGAQFYGFTDTIAIVSATLTNLSNDAWGIDDVSYNVSTTQVPEPSSLALIGAGLVGLAYFRRRRNAS